MVVVVPRVVGGTLARECTYVEPDFEHGHIPLRLHLFQTVKFYVKDFTANPVYTHTCTYMVG